MTTPQSADIDVARIAEGRSSKINVLVVSSVALAFISFWRAAAIVLCDLASTAYYIGGISEQAVGKAAPWFILGVMLFSYAVRAVYVESCTMFTRGGVYRVVKEAMGGSLAKLSVSALMFDYILTGPISAVAAGQYIIGLFFDMFNLLAVHNHHAVIQQTNYQGSINFITCVIAIVITIYFWRTNIIGIHESSDKALRIMQLTTVMSVIVIVWSLITLCIRHATLHGIPMAPVFTDTATDGSESSKGWLEHLPRLVGTLGVIIAFGHTLLAMSGEESLAQVNREIEAPKLKNLLRTGFVIFLYSMLLTSLVSFFAVLIIPDGMRVSNEIVLNGHKPKTPGVDYVEVDYLRNGPIPDGSGRSGLWGNVLTRTTDAATGEVTTIPTSTVRAVEANEHVERDNGTYRDNLINGLVHFLVGPAWLKLVVEIFVVVVGFLILAGAVNTSIVGSNGVLNRLAEDGVLTPWFLHPQKRFGTTHRLINLVTIMQLATIILSRGDVDTLGEAYAFGVIWSFVFKTLAMCVLRFKDKSHRQYEVPFNIRKKSADGREIDLPIGIMIIFLVLLSTALVNLVTKKTATEWGVGFTIAFLAAFVILEQISHRRQGGGHHMHLEQFNERNSDELSVATLGLTHPAPLLIAARGPRSLPVLTKVLKEIDTDARDVVVVTCKVLPALTQGVTDNETTINDEDRKLLTQIVTVAEEIGKQVHPVVLPTNNPLFAIATAVRDLGATEVVLGVSEKQYAEAQLEQFAMAWGSATADAQYKNLTPLLIVRIVGPQVEMRYELQT